MITLLLGKALGWFLTHFDCCFMGYTQLNVAITHLDSFILNLHKHQWCSDWLWVRLVGCCLVPLSPLLFCWWAELADRSSGTAMGSSASSDASLAGGLSLPGETHTSKHPSLSTPPLDVSHSGEAKLPPGGARACLWAYCIYFLHSMAQSCSR